MTYIKNVLSLFDGISCGQLALQEANIKYDNYYAFEIDQHCIDVTQSHFPDTHQLGDITLLKVQLDVDLLLCGFPCQAFSFAGDMKGFEDARGSLFYDAVNILRAVKPKWFLFENVKMKKVFRDVVSKELGVEPVLINSNLFTAQNRPRYYWTNIPILPIKDRQVHIKDVLFNRYLGSMRPYLSHTKIDKYDLRKYLDLREVVNFTERRTEESKRIRREHMRKYGRDWSPRRGKEMVPRKDGKVNCLTTGLTKEHIVLDHEGKLRYLVPEEFERLQGLPFLFTEGATDRQRYKMCGNGWTVPVISHILKGMNYDNNNQK